jgi:hypothetical protein
MWLSLVYDGLINFRGSADSCFYLSIFTLTLLFNFVKFFKEILDLLSSFNRVAIAYGVRPRCVNAGEKRFDRHQCRC